MKIVVTGYEGFIGSKLYSALKNNHEVFGVGAKDEFPDADIIFHLGAHVDVERSWKEPFWVVENITSTIKVAQKYHDKKIIYIGSTNKDSPYGISKWAGEEFAILFCKKTVIIRLPRIGVDDLDDLIISLVDCMYFEPNSYIYEKKRPPLV